MSISRALCLLAASLPPILLLLASCSSGPAPIEPSPRPSHAPSTPPSGPVDPAPVDGWIGPEGGTITHASGGRIIVPPGALAARTRLTLTAAPAPSQEALGALPLWQTLEAGPEGQTFLRPIDVVLPYDETRVRIGTDVTTLQVRMAPHGSADFIALDSWVDRERHELHSQTVHFTQFVPAQSPNPVFITEPTSLPQATVGAAYAQSFAATGGTLPYAWSLAPGSSLVPGLTLATSGSLGGTPTTPASSGFFVVVHDAAGHAVQKAFALTVVPPLNPVPVLAQLAPSTAVEGSGPISVSFTGSSFVPASTARWDGQSLATTFVDTTSLGASVPAALLVPGTHQLSVMTPGPGGGTSADVAFVVAALPKNPIPMLVSVSPLTLPVSAIDTQIAIVGGNFITGTSAAIGAQGIPTRFVSSTQLDATIPASYLAAAGTLQIGVFNPTPGGGFSATTVPIAVVDGSCSCAPRAHMTVTSCTTSCTYACDVGWSDLDGDPLNGCETDTSSSVTCIQRTQTPGTCAWAVTVETPIHFSFMQNYPAPGPPSEEYITSSSTVIAAFHLQQPNMIPYFFANADHSLYTAQENHGQIVRSGTLIDVTFSAGRAALVNAPPGCVGARFYVSCAGKTWIAPAFVP